MLTNIQVRDSRQNKFTKIVLFTVFLIFSACANKPVGQQIMAKEFKTPAEIINQAPASHWRSLDLDNTLYLFLDSGIVVVELSPDFAPKHARNTKKLVRAGIFDDTSFYRVIDGFVAQGGPLDEVAFKSKPNMQFKLEEEFTRTDISPQEFVPLGETDSYAEEVGYVNGFAAGRTADQQRHWLLHCYGAFAMGRTNDVNSGGTELYVVIGQAQRYLDRNTTVFGRVITGMEHIQALHRSSTLQGAVDVREKNKINQIRVAKDVPKDEQIDLQIMKTQSSSFRSLINARSNRKHEWFVYQHNAIDVCSVPVPVRLLDKSVETRN